MKLLHRLLTTAGLAALIAPHSVEAARIDGLDGAASGRTQAAGFRVAAVGQVEAPSLEAMVTAALGGRPATVEAIAAVLPAIVAQAIAAAPPGVTPAQVAAEVAQAVSASLGQAGVGLDVAAQANIASEVVGAVEPGFADQGVSVDRAAVASAALGGFAGAADAAAAPPAGYTAATGPTAAAAETLDAAGPADGANSAY
jgi:hypothetical protein